MPGAKVAEEVRREQLLAAAVAVGTRDGLEALSARRVAAEAAVSHGLVFFHFGSMDGLHDALLETLLAGALDAEVTEQIAGIPDPADRLLAMLREELEGIPSQLPAIELFFAYWVSGRRRPAVRARITAAFDRYRATFEPVARDVVAADPAAWSGVTGEGLARSVVSLVQGASVQAVLTPAGFDLDQAVGAARGLLSRGRAGLPAG